MMKASECIDPEALEGWELEAYAEGNVSERVAEHLARCAACRDQVEESMSLERDLRQILYRFDCPSPNTLRDYHWRYLPAGEREKVEAHLGLCPHCAAELTDLAEFVTMEPAKRSRSLLAQARGAAERARLAVARLVSPAQRPVLAMRGETREVLLFEADDVALSVNLEQEKTGTYALFGQVLLPEGHAEGYPERANGIVEGPALSPVEGPVLSSVEGPVLSSVEGPALSPVEGTPDTPGSYARLTEREQGMPPAQAAIDANGGFMLPDLRPGTYQLVVQLPERRVVVPDLTLEAVL